MHDFNDELLSSCRCYSIFDKVANRFLPAVMYDSDWFAVSTFKQLATTSGNAISDSPHDYSLYYIGTFCTMDGTLKPLEIKEFICDASDFIVSEVKNNGVQDNLQLQKTE